MKTYFTEFFERFAYPEEARVALWQGYERIASDAVWGEALEGLLRQYEEDINCDMGAMIKRMAGISAGAGVHEYTGSLILFICMSKTLRRYYRERQVEEQIWHTSMCDLKWKLDECRSVYGVWGTFVPDWFQGFFRMRRFGFGKLQFESWPFGHRYERNGLELTPESIIINVHIPRTGGRLGRKDQNQSYRQAGKFFRERFGIAPVFVCNSWLLFPRNKEVLSPSSNLYAFISDYEILESGEYEDYSEVWRLFDRNYEGDVEQLPQDTSFRRAYADWIRKGEKTGWGYGMFVLEP